MDKWKYFGITHRDQVILNPTSSAKLDEMIDLLDLPAGSAVLDIACGKAEFLTRIVERYGAVATGIDLSPEFILDARELVISRIPDANVTLLEMDGADYQGDPTSFDLAICLGASWIFNGHAGALRALASFVRPGGQILVGEPFWIKEPDEEYLQAANLERDIFGTHHGNVQTGVDLGLTPLYAMVSNGDDWDRYEALHWRAGERWAVENPDDPDRQEVLERCRDDRDVYLRWGRETLGWALYLFRVDATS